jgi:FAD/FMN-containing dehydrogenase
VNTGHVVVGNVGGEDRFDYSAIGDPVNLSARLEPANKTYGTLVMTSEFTVEAATAEDFRLRELDLIAVKGKSKPVRVYEVLELADVPLDPSLEEALEHYESGLAAYRNRDWELAAEYFSAAVEAHHDADRKELWKLRKSGLPILLGRTSDAKHISFLEDCAVPPEHLAEYVSDFRSVLAEHGTFASFYAHAGPGVLHVRPLVETKTVEGVETMRAIADDVTDLIVEYGGSVSGEHGDGRARTQWNRKRYGDELWSAFRDLKTAFDPDWILNPGQVCGDVDMTEDLRFGPDYDFDSGFEPALAWENENGF